MIALSIAGFEDNKLEAKGNGYTPEYVKENSKQHSKTREKKHRVKREMTVEREGQVMKKNQLVIW